MTEVKKKNTSTLLGDKAKVNTSKLSSKGGSKKAATKKKDGKKGGKKVSKKKTGAA